MSDTHALVRVATHGRTERTKPMTEQHLLFARQPIHDRNLRIAGYELLFRAPNSDHAEDAGAERMTAEVVTRALLDIGLDNLIGSSRAWINVSREFLVERVFRALPPERVVLEVLETVWAEEPVLEALREARALGFRIALDDYVVTSQTVGLLDLCDIVKIDCFGRSPADIEAAANCMRASGRRLLAEKIETKELYEFCRGCGFELFQGYFFTRPSEVHGTASKSDHVRLMQLVAELNDPDTSIERVVELIQCDVALAYRLLRYVNSAHFGRNAQINHLRDAITMLGIDRVRARATLLALASSKSDKPLELANTALVRARYCQMLGATRSGDPHKHFIVGLLSVLDAYLDEPMEQILAKLPLASDLGKALATHSGALGQVLESALACEMADWDNAAVVALDAREMSASYVAALTWAEETRAALADL
jgi:EAL and modified HD-GYP domain-containing signal transduction protein